MRRRSSLLALLAVVVVSVVSAVGAAPAHATIGLKTTPDPGVWMTNGVVYASALSEDGKTLYIGGRFTQLRQKPPGQGGQTLAVNNLAAINVATGTPVSTWRPNVASDGSFSPVVRALAVRNGQVYIGGRFTSVNGQPRQNLAAVDESSGALSPLSATVGTSNSTVYAVLPSDTELYIGGTFSSVNGVSRQNLAAFKLPSGALDTSWKPKAKGGTVHDLKFSTDGNTIFAAGGFTSVVGSDRTTAPRQSVARFDTATGNVDPWAIPAGTIENPMIAWDMTVTSSRLYVGFGDKPNYAAAFRLDNGNSGDEVWRYNTVGNVQSVAFSPDGSRLIIGGHFGINPLDQQVCGGSYLKGLAALNPDTGTIDCNWLPTLDEKTRPNYNGGWTLTTTSNYLYVGGGFIGVSGVPQYNLARFTYDPTYHAVDYATPTIDLNGFEHRNGLQRGGLNATYYDNQDFTGTQVSRVDPTVNFDWGNGSPDPAIGPDTFSARWTGQIEAPVSGDYTFTTTSDDGVRLYIGGQKIIDDWGDHAPTDDSGTITLQAGQRYDIQMDYYEDGGGAVAKLQWSYPGQSQQVVPSNDLLYTGDNGGLDATYYDNQDFTGTQVSRVDPTVNFDWGNGSPDPAIGPDTFSARWTGQIEAPVSGDYTFTTTSDDGVRLFVNGQELIDDWGDHAPTDDSGTITLQAGQRYDIQMDYYEDGGGAVAKLQWSYPGQPEQVVPSSVLYNTGGDTGYSTSFNPGGGPVSIVDPDNLVVADADDVNIKSATVMLTSMPDGASESLSASTAGTGITATYDAQNGVLHLNGSASKADYEKVLRTVTYNDTAANPTAGTRTVYFSVNDGVLSSNTAVSTVYVQ
ncbi:PA14 domain-containing protein [Rubrobacter calidifluminis]|uniref:PA14 domain-containing protein n=1 Tax=Rubrobacter calidifluminis TaxID=1392640 RepID=UPI00235EE2C5|nr:PA14 domain-containing protein [Rubrobacter calidifluminis]